MSKFKTMAAVLAIACLVQNAWADPQAKQIETKTTAFNQNLSPADNNVQKALETLDEIEILVDAAGIAFDPPTYPTVADALNSLLYVAPVITALTNNRNVLENGSSVTTTTLDWTVNKTMTTESLDNGIGALAPATLLTYLHTSTYSTNRTYTLTVGDGTSTDQATTTVSFRNSNYSGVSANATLTSGQINALTATLATSKTQTLTGLNPSGQYIYVAYPASYGLATFTVNGFSSDDWVLAVQSHTNASGAVVSYNVYRTNALLTGTYNVGVS